MSFCLCGYQTLKWNMEANYTLTKVNQHYPPPINYLINTVFIPDSQELSYILNLGVVNGDKFSTKVTMI